MATTTGLFSYVPYDADNVMSYFGTPEEWALPVQDLRSELESSSFPYHLDTHGFTALKHTTALTSDKYNSSSWFDRDLLEEICYPELVSILQEQTKAKKIMVLGGTLRSLRGKNPDELDGPGPQLANRPGRGTPIYDPIRPRIHGTTAGELCAPAPRIHIDYSAKGAQSLLRHWRQDIADEAKDIIEAEDAAAAAAATGETPEHASRRYAIYSIWRPLEPVKRDPLAFMDGRTSSPTDLVQMPVRNVGIDEKLVMVETSFSKAGVPKGQECRHKWFWISNQQPDEIVILKLYDSTAGTVDGRIVGTPHGSFTASGMESQPPRKSIEVRLVAFW